MFLKKFDFISPEINLLYKDSNKHSSIISGILSLLLIIFLIIFITFIYIDFLSNKNINFIKYNKYLENSDLNSFNKSEIFHYIIFNNLTQIDLRAISIISFDNIDYNSYNKDLNFSNSSFYIYKSCFLDNNINFYKNLDPENKKILNKSYCIKAYYNKEENKLIDILDKKFSNPFNVERNNFYQNIYIKRCQNNTIINDNTCYDEKTIDNYVKNNIFNYSILFKDIFIDIPNKNIQYKIKNISNILNSDYYFENHLNFIPFKMKIYSGKLFQSVNEQNEYKFQFNKNFVNSYNKNIYASIHFLIKNEIEIYEYHDKKLQDIIGGIYGIIEFFYMIVKLFNLYIFYDYYVIHDFNIEIEKKIQKYGFKFSPPKKNEYVIKINRTPTIKFNEVKNFNTLKDLMCINKEKEDLKSSSHSNINFLQNNFLDLNKSKRESVKKIEENFDNIKKNVKKFNLIDFLKVIKLKLKKNNYLIYLYKKRKQIISEENLIKEYFIIKNLKDTVIKTMYNNYNVNNKISIINHTVDNNIKKNKINSNLKSLTSNK